MSLKWLVLVFFWRCLGEGCWDAETLAAPKPHQNHSEWLAELKSWREEHSKRYQAEAYKDPTLTWTRTSYVQPQIHLYDRFLFDGFWTTERYLDDLEHRYGGIDSVLIWPTYTNIGIDDRNQFDYFRAVPGGLQALTNLTASFHKRNVKVLWAYNPWDQATRDEGHHWDVLATLLKATGGDGFNGDTMTSIPKQFWDAGALRHFAFAAEPEGNGVPCDSDFSSAGWTPLGWGYFGQKRADRMTMKYDHEPGVDKMKWLDPRGRHLTHVCDRWSKSRATAIQLAFFNGDGYESWENIWGLYNQLTDRDAELLRRSATLLRWAGQRNLSHDFDDWVPHAPEATDGSRGIFASRFEKAKEALWLVINKGEDAEIDVRIPKPYLAEGFEIFDLYHGNKVTPQTDGVVKLGIEASGISALLATARGAQEEALLKRMRSLSQRHLAEFSDLWHVLPQKMDPRPSSKIFDSSSPPPEMVLLPRMKFNFSSSGTEFEGGCDPADDPNDICCKSRCVEHGGPSCQCGVVQLEYFGVDVQFPWEERPERNHGKSLDLGPFLIDRDLVTNADYLRYLNASGYSPADNFNFLKHWQTGGPKPGDEQKPVVNIGFEEAERYCLFYGKRLPHSYEWQVAAQGSDGRKYPWGDHWDPAAVPPPGHDPEIIRKHQKGTSVFGVHDLIGNVWQYTDSFRDEHTRAVLLRGSSRYNPQVSEAFPSLHQSVNWYFPPARELNKHSKYFLMSDSYERAGTLGFRCAGDVANGAPAPYHYRSEEHQKEVQFV